MSTSTSTSTSEVFSNFNLSYEFIKSYGDNVINFVDNYNAFTKQVKGSSFELTKSKFTLDGSGILYKKYNLIYGVLMNNKSIIKFINNLLLFARPHHS